MAKRGCTTLPGHSLNMHSFKKYLLSTIIKIKEDRGCQGRERRVRCWAEWPQ